MLVQLHFEAVSVFMQAQQLDRAVPTLQKLHDTSNTEWQEAIQRDAGDENLVNKHKCVTFTHP